jgi:hypothetical protein
MQGTSRLFEMAVKRAAVEPQCIALPEDDAEQSDQLTSLMEGGGVVVPQLDGAEPMVSISVAPSLICA